MDSRWLWGVVLVIIVAAGGWYVFSHPTTSAPTTVDTDMQQATTSDMGASEAMAPAPVTVTYTDQGFSPASVAITEGQTVMWVNQSSHTMWIASGVHPTHTVYDGTSKDKHCAADYTGPVPFDSCAAVDPSASYSFTFTRVGTWKYHDHTHSSVVGTVIVAAAPSTGDDTSASTSVKVNAE